MVTILEEPKVETLVEPVLDEAVESRPRAGYVEWRYAMPFPGVKYFSFQPERVPERKVPVKPLVVELIDERVILL